jgi:hypothetical protein
MFKVNTDYLRHAYLPEALVSTKRGAPTLAKVVARTSNVPQSSPNMLPPPIKRQKQHVNPTKSKGYNSPFSPWLIGPKRQPRIHKTAAQERLDSSSADRSPIRKPESTTVGTAESPIIVEEMDKDKKSTSSSSAEKPVTTGTGSGKTPGTGSRSNHREARKDIVNEQNRIVSEAKEEAEKQRRNDEKETREKEDLDNQKTNFRSSRNEKKDKKTKKKSSRSDSKSRS